MASTSTPPLRSAEVARCIAVLEATIERLTLLSAIYPDFAARRRELSRHVGDQIANSLRDQQELERRFEALVADRNQAEATGNRARRRAATQEMKEVGASLRENTRILKKNLTETPHVGVNLAKLITERDDLVALLYSTIDELATTGKYTCLTHFIKTQQVAAAQLQSVEAEERAVREQVEELEKLVVSEAAAHTQEMEEKQREVDRLQVELRDLRSSVGLEIHVAHADAAAEAEARARAYRLEEAELEAECAALATQLQREEDVHAEMVSYLQDQQAEIQEHTASWNAKSKDDVEAKDEELQVLVAQAEKDREELATLTEQFMAFKAKLESTQAAREADEAREAAATELQQRQSKAAARLQSVVLPCFQHIQKRIIVEKELKKKSKAKKK